MLRKSKRGASKELKEEDPGMIMKRFVCFTGWPIMIKVLN